MYYIISLTHGSWILQRDTKSFIDTHIHVRHQCTSRTVRRNGRKWGRERKEAVHEYGQSTRKYSYVNTFMKSTTKYNNYITIKMYHKLPSLCTSPVETRQHQYQILNYTHDPGLSGYLWGMPCHLPIPGMQRFKLEEEILYGSAPS